MALFAGLPAESRFASEMAYERDRTDWRAALARATGQPMATDRMTLDQASAAGVL